jgi:N-acetyl sugar amidotransferase
MKKQQESIFCKKCLYSTSHPLGLVLDSNGICTGCRVHEEKYELDWKYRFEILKKITKEYKSKNQKNYDCIIPVSGGAESYWVVHVVKNLLGLNPLLVTYNKYYNTDIGIWNLANLRIKFDCDILFQNVDPRKVKKITKQTFREFGSLYWHCIAGQTNFPVQTAIDFKVPLIVWGGHQGVEQVGMFSHLHEVEMSRRYRKDHDIMSIEADNLLSGESTLNEDDIWQYRYPEDHDLNKIGVRGIYLSNFLPWDPKVQDEKMIKQYNVRTTKLSRTFDTYEHVDCFNYMNVHDLLKLNKHGFSKVTDHACREIRHKRITRIDAEKLVKHYEQKEIEYSDIFLEWLGIDKTVFTFLLDRHKNNKYWELLDWDTKEWKFKGLSYLRRPKKETFNNKTINLIEKKNKFISTHKYRNDKNYITIGRGYP